MRCASGREPKRRRAGLAIRAVGIRAVGMTAPAIAGIAGTFEILTRADLKVKS